MPSLPRNEPPRLRQGKELKRITVHTKISYFDTHATEHAQCPSRMVSLTHSAAQAQNVSELSVRPRVGTLWPTSVDVNRIEGLRDKFLHA